MFRTEDRRPVTEILSLRGRIVDPDVAISRIPLSPGPSIPLRLPLRSRSVSAQDRLVAISRIPQLLDDARPFDTSSSTASRRLRKVSAPFDYTQDGAEYSGRALIRGLGEAILTSPGGCPSLHSGSCGKPRAIKGKSLRRGTSVVNLIVEIVNL